MVRKLEKSDTMSYKTNQRTQLYDFLKKNPHTYFTARQIADALSSSGADISISAIYRNLSALSEEGKIRKSVQKNSRETCYRYVDSEACRDEIHITCSECGKIFHMDHKLSALLQDHLSNSQGFELDKSKTVIYGICNECRRHH